MGKLHVNMNVTLDGVIQANGGPTVQDGDFEHAGWEAMLESGMEKGVSEGYNKLDELLDSL